MTRNVYVPLPENLAEGSAYLFKPYTRYEIADLTIRFLNNVFVTATGLVMDKDGLVSECHHDYPDQRSICSAEAFQRYQEADADPDRLIDLEDDNTYLLIHHPWYNYYHWLCECVPRLCMVGDKAGDMILLLPDYYADSDWINGSLEPFAQKNIFYIPRDKSLFVGNLCMPQIKPICDSYHINILKDLRTLYLNYFRTAGKKDLDLGEKIYLSRKRAARKKVLNEDLVEQLMTEFGFTIVNNEDYSFWQQVGIYSHARFLVSIHGSGLTNMLFMQPSSSILEIHKKKTNTLDHPSFVFWYQAAALDFRYYHQLCEPPDENDDYFFGDFDIDIPLLRRNLTAMLQ